MIRLPQRTSHIMKEKVVILNYKIMDIIEAIVTY